MGYVVAIVFVALAMLGWRLHALTCATHVYQVLEGQKRCEFDHLCRLTGATPLQVVTALRNHLKVGRVRFVFHVNGVDYLHFKDVPGGFDPLQLSCFLEIVPNGV